MLNLEWLRTFKTIYEEGTLTATANKLHMSQPGVSVHLSSLEAYVGSVLFERLSKKMIATEQGVAMYNQISSPITELLGIESELMKNKKGEKPTLTVGICMEGFSLSLERHLSQLSFNIVNRFSGDKSLLSDLEKGITDIAFTSSRKNIPGIKYITLVEDNIMLVGSNAMDGAPIKNAFSDGDKNKLLELLKIQNWFGLSNDDAYFIRFWNHHFGTKHRFKLNSIVPNYGSILNSLKYGNGIAVVPDYLANDAITKGEVQQLWKGDETTIGEVYFAYRKKSIYKDQIMELLNLFK